MECLLSAYDHRELGANTKTVLVLVLKTRAAETHATKFCTRDDDPQSISHPQQKKHTSLLSLFCNVDHLTFSLTLYDFGDTVADGIRTDCKFPSVSTPGFAEGTFVARPCLCRVAGRSVSVRAPVYRGCPCRDPPVCHRVQGDSVAKRQPL